jgi:hypothetical protein
MSKGDVLTSMPVILLTALILGWNAYNVLLPVLTDTGETMWDFKKDYYAAKAHSLGLNPYLNADLAAVSGEIMPLPYVYPPPTLLFFKIFNLFDYQSAQYLYLLFKGVLLVGIFSIWKRLLKDGFNIEFLVFSVLAFNASLLVDLHTGNASLLEQFLLWLGFSFYLRNRLPQFCICVLAASAFKLMPAAFLLLLLFTKDDRRRLLFGLSALILVCYLLFSHLATPSLFAHYMRNAEIGATRMGFERGVNNPSTLALIRDWATLMGYVLKIRLPHLLPYIIYAVVASGVLYHSLHGLKVLQSGRRGDRRLQMVLLACLTFVLVAPRFKNYTYFLLAPAAYAVLGNPAVRKYRSILSVLIILPLSPLMPRPEFLLGMWGYYPLLLVYGLWALETSNLVPKVPEQFRIR